MAFVVLALVPALGAAANLPIGFSETQVAGGLAKPTAMAVAADGRLFVALQGGQLRIVKNGSLLPTPFVTLTVDANGERGLLGVAIGPNFATNRHVYVYYTATTPVTHNRISRFTASGDEAVPGSEVVILELNNLTTATNHNGGALRFGPDGKLYVGVGENATPFNAQTLNNLLGKILRINPDGTIPTDNPFYASATGQNRAIWALGLRNPFRFAIQRGTGKMFINDVGQGGWEEIDDGQAGANFGWPATEGYTSDPHYDSPFYAYRNDGSTCAITGGTFYDPVVAQFPTEYVGQYFFTDYCAGWIRRIDPADNAAVTEFASGLSFPVDLRTGADGSLYYLTRGTGSNTGVLGRIRYVTGEAPTVTAQPSDQTVAIGQSATFSVTASGTAPLSYRWLRNGVPIPGAVSSSYTQASATAADNGEAFQCVVSNSFGTTTSVPATLTVTNNQPPTATITTPVAGTLYRGGQWISFGGTAVDPQEGMLPASAFTWEVRFHHDDHHHPVLGPISGQKGGSFKVPTIGETSVNVFYRIILTVTDSHGLTRTVVRDVQPQKVTLRLAASSPNLRLSLDGQLRTAPFSVIAVVGMWRSIEAPTPQPMGGKTYRYQSWSDSVLRTHTISVPAVNTTYTATYAATGMLTVDKAGTGTGTVRSGSIGVNCGIDCTQAYPVNTVVTLTAVPSASSTFTRWSGACSGTGPCTMTMTSNKSATAIFTLRPRTLSVSNAGTGAGTVASTPSGVNCGVNCAEAYPHGTVVTLTATPWASSTFTGWSGACSGTGTCSITMTGNRSVTATFAVQTPAPPATAVVAPVVP